MITEFKISSDKQDKYFAFIQERLSELANGTLAIIFNLHEAVDVDEYTTAFLSLIDKLKLLQNIDDFSDGFDSEARNYHENLAVVIYLADRILRQGLMDNFQALCPDDGICVNMGDYSMFVPQSGLMTRYNLIYIALDRFWKSGSSSIDYVHSALQSNSDDMTQFLDAMEKVGMKLVKVST